MTTLTARGALDAPPSDTYDDQGSGSAEAPPPARGWLDRVVFGPDGQARWIRPSVLGLLAATAALYLIGLSASGNANEFYAAAVQAGTKSVKAWLFGSLDAGNSITVDKPPAAFWAMVLSARIFGFSSFAMLLPQALLGVGTVGVTYAAVKRWSGAVAGLIAGALVALTPVAALMFKFNNPDAMLVFLITLGAYLVVRALDASRTDTDRPGRAMRWLFWAGVAIGFAFLAKMLQGLLVLPAFALVYVVAARFNLKRRLLHILAGLAGLVVASGWFIALVSLWPAADRPYIGGSTNNSLWELAIGYNGLGRIFGGSGNGGGGGGQNTGFGGSTGIGRLFNTAFATEISWFLPAALLGLVAVLVMVWRTPRTNRTRASLILWGGSLVVSALVFSFMQGTVHPYYAVALAPSIGAVVGVSGEYLWRTRASVASRAVLAAMIAVTSVWSFYLLAANASSWMPWLRFVVLIGGLLGAGLLVVGIGALRKFAAIGLIVGAVSAAGGSAAYTVATAAQAHSGSIPASGPAGYTSSGFGGGGPGGNVGTAPGGTTSPSGQRAAGTGGFGGGGSSDSSLTKLLSATTSTWSAAVIGSQTAAGYELSSNTSVMAIGGWDGSDPSISLADFQTDVANAQIHYFISGGQGGRGGFGGSSSSTSASQITAWVQAHYAATTVGNATVYDLTKATS